MTGVMDDNSLMPFGQYKGYKLANVPASYLLWIYDNLKLRADLKKYIEDNKDVLKAQVKQTAKAARR